MFIPRYEKLDRKWYLATYLHWNLWQNLSQTVVKTDQEFSPRRLHSWFHSQCHLEPCFLVLDYGKQGWHGHLVKQWGFINGQRFSSPQMWLYCKTLVLDQSRKLRLSLVGYCLLTGQVLPCFLESTRYWSNSNMFAKIIHRSPSTNTLAEIYTLLVQY